MLKRFVSAILCAMLALTTTVVYYADSPGYSVEADVDFTPPPYYYNQLSNTAKKIYAQLKAAAMECQKTVKMDDIKMEDGDFEKVIELLIMHDPVTFNIYNISATTTSASYTNNSQKTKKYSTTFTIDYTYKKSTYDKMVAAYEKKVDNILSKLTDDMSKYKKIRVIHDEIIKTAVYDLETAASGTIYGALVDKRAKCDGYAKTFSYICEKAGIRTITVLGDASHSDGETEYHMWNKVYYNKQWYNVDVTWDDPITNMKENYSHEYFMISDEEIGKNHVEDNMSFAVPEASDNSLNYYQVNKKYADSLNSAKSLMTKGITSAAKNGSTYYEFKCSSKSVYDEVKKYIEDSGNINSILKTSKKNSGKKILTNIYSHLENDDLYTIRIMFYYEGTGLDDYYIAPDSLDNGTITALAKVGIK